MLKLHKSKINTNMYTRLFLAYTFYFGINTKYWKAITFAPKFKKREKEKKKNLPH